MRGTDGGSGSLFSYVDLESRVRSDHPLRVIREIANAALEAMTEDFAALYPPRLGRPSIPPELSTTAKGPASAGFSPPLVISDDERGEALARIERVAVNLSRA